MAAEGRLGEDEARRQVAIPQGVREVVGRRLDRLSAEANATLAPGRGLRARRSDIGVLELVCGLAPVTSS